MRVSVVGTGYVGLVSGVCLAAKGHEVVCVDVDAEKVARINSGQSPIYEQGLEGLLKGVIGRRLQATTELVEAVRDTEISLIAVGTPFDGNEIDLTFVRTVAQEIGRVLKEKPEYHVVAVKSTVVPGTTDSVVQPILESASGKRAGDHFGLGMNPEFLREGAAVHDFMNPDRIVLGGVDDRTVEVLKSLYSVFDGVPVVSTNTRTAEMIKYSANSLLATMISFSNEIANLSSALGDIDVVDVMRGVHLDHRLQPVMDNGERIVPKFTTYIEAGCGFGGSCFPKDVKALIAHGRQNGLPMSILSSVIEVNANQPNEVIKLLHKHLGDLAGKRILVLGLAFKPETDDMRESPAIPVIRHLAAENAVISAYDPVAQTEAAKVFQDLSITYHDSLSNAVARADAVVLMTRWKEFESLPTLFSDLPKQPVLIDGRRMLEKSSVRNYDGIGL